MISPISDEATPERRFLRRKADYLLQQVIRPACEAGGWTALRMDEHRHGGWIPEAMLRKLSACPMAVALLEAAPVTGANPGSETDAFNANVVYEIGLRHAWCLPVVLLCPDANLVLPFDLRDMEAARYPAIVEGRCEAPFDPGWPVSRLREVREELTHRIAVAASHDTPSSRLAPFLQRHNRVYGLKLMFRLKRRTLETLNQFLMTFDLDSSADYDLGSNAPEARARLAALLDFPLKDYVSDLKAYQAIAREELAEVHIGGDLANLCLEMESVARQMAGLRRRLRDPASGYTSEEAHNATGALRQKIRDCLSLFPA